MKYLSMTIAAVAALFYGIGCQQLPLHQKYDVVAYKPKNPNNVRVLVSLNKEMVYVMEGNTPLLVTATSIGKPDHPTHTGHFYVMNKIIKKRSGEYGFWVKGNTILAGTSGHSPGSGFHYMGYPMAFWVEYESGYGFHSGSVWPVPRSHGCLRLHQNVAAKFFTLVKIGTPVYIAQTQPQDATLGAAHKRPTDYNDPDAPSAFLISDAVFKMPDGTLLVEQK